MLNLLLLLTFLPTLLTATSPTPSICPQNKTLHPSFTFYILSLQWPFSICSITNPHTQNCRYPPPTFTIRSFYPTKSTAQPTCCGSPFSLSTILDIAPALRRFWPDFSSTANDQALWQSQWLLYGSCTGLVLRTYFRKVLELSRRYDFLRTLNSHGIVASEQSDHRFADVQHALDEATGGFRVAVRCIDVDGHAMLDAVHVCLEKSRFDTVNCPKRCPAGKHCCDPERSIRIPYWRHEQLVTNDTSGIQPHKDPDDPGFLVWHVIGFLVLAAGVAYWLFKQFLEQIEQNRPRTNRTGYTGIPTN